MTPERAAYYRLMLLAGEWEAFERELDFALETEDPITSPILDLALCMSDLNQTVSILHNYTRQTGVDQQQVYDMVMKELRNQYLSGKLDAEGTCKTLEAIKRCCDCDDPWRDLYTYLYEFELLNDGIISQEVFEAGFASVFLRGERLDVWTLEKEHKQKRSPHGTSSENEKKGVYSVIEVIGAYNTALCYTGELEEAAAVQIKAVCDQPAFSDSKIRIMPDVHAGMGCTIGTTMTITDKIVPGMVGVDIGCGMETVRIAEKEIDFARLDEIVHKYIPCGREVRSQPHKLNDQIDLTQLRCSPYVNLSRAQRSIGTLGGGNHFIEVDRGENGDLYIVVHSGSRHIGNEVAKYYQDEGRKAFWGGARHQVDAAVAELKAQGRFQEIQPTINRLRKEHEIAMPKDLAYVEGRLFDDYIHDMKIIQHFATLNRKAMMDVILVGMRLTAVEQFTTIHNYIDTDNMILRKGAVAAYEGQKLLIPINMRDGSLICIGKGNPDWNCSAPHGAGRLMSRKEAFKRLSLDEYRREMEGIYTTCVDRTTLDEAPMAYKGIDEIISNIGPTVEIVERIIPVYNFKAAE